MPRNILPACLLATALCWAVSDSSAADQADPPRSTSATRGRSLAVERFVRDFRGATEPSRWKLLNGLVRSHLDDRGVAGALWQAVEEAIQSGQTTPSVLAAVRLLGRFDDAATIERLSSLLQSRERRLSMTALDVLAAHQREAALPSMIALAQRADFAHSYPLRHAAVHAVGQFRTTAAVDFLIDLLPRFDGQLRYETARQLSSLTGENFGGRAEAWAEWRRRHGPELPLASFKEPQFVAAADDMPWDEPLPRFFGAPVYASRMVFVIDVSKSMLSSVGGETRLESVQAELRAAIDALPSDAWFEILAFNDAIDPWQGKLVPATDGNRRLAHAFVNRLDARGKTACHDGVMTGLTLDEQTEALLFLSDGKPTAGRIRNLATILKSVTEANEFRRISINALAVDSRGKELNFMKALAEQNFGECRLVR